jgi:DNA (cytosine-5)-methyltransferase 1
VANEGGEQARGNESELMNELALFSGAGGGLLAGHLLGWRTICAVEYDSKAAGVLVARQNDGSLEPFPIWDDVRTFDGRPWRGRVDIVSGGFPCQAYSSAAAGKNTADDLWPEQRRIVADVAPWFVFAENVQRRAIDRAADDCEEMGYAVQCISLAAADLGADHIRPRHWLLAHAHRNGELLRAIHAEACMRPCLPARVWAGEPAGSRVADGLADGMDGARAAGNGQVPGVAAAAFVALLEAAIAGQRARVGRPSRSGVAKRHGQMNERAIS